MFNFIMEVGYDWRTMLCHSEPRFFSLRRRISKIIVETLRYAQGDMKRRLNNELVQQQQII